MSNSQSPQFVCGREYHRKNDIHDWYGGSGQSGISPSAKFPFVFLFTSNEGEKYGYSDGFQEDGTYWYTGAGQLGDMTMSRGNLAIKTAAEQGKTLHLFEKSRPSFVRYLGEVLYLKHHEINGPDKSGQVRKMIVFEFSLQTDDQERDLPDFRKIEDKAPFKGVSTDKLRQLAYQSPKAAINSSHRLSVVRKRSLAVKEYVKRRAGGFCEGCGSRGPFEGIDGMPFLEVHHVSRLADGGEDHPRWVIALCPNCHRHVHCGADGNQFNSYLVTKLKELEPLIV